MIVVFRFIDNVYQFEVQFSCNLEIDKEFFAKNYKIVYAAKNKRTSRRRMNDYWESKHTTFMEFMMVIQKCKFINVFLYLKILSIFIM